MRALAPLLSFIGHRRSESKPRPREESRTPRFVCRTCGTKGPFYVARQVTNWTGISQPWRAPSGDLTYRTLNTCLPGMPGPPLSFLCGHCRTSCQTLEELVIEPAFLEAVAE